jgi:hypothetical protein
MDFFYGELVQVYLREGLEILGTLSVLATLLVRLPAFKKHAGSVDGAVGKVVKVIQWMPTIGVNPRTKALEQAIQDFKK